MGGVFGLNRSLVKALFFILPFLFKSGIKNNLNLKVQYTVIFNLKIVIFFYLKKHILLNLNFNWLEIWMFGMTKRQFLKKSAKCMDETGGLLLLLREILEKESQEKISNEEASRRIDDIRKGIESVFYKLEKSNPPSTCSSLKQKILNILINLQEIIVTNSESLSAARKGSKELSRDKLKESRDKLEMFRKDFHEVTKRVNILLNEVK